MSKKSRVWNFFYKESDTVAICCLCHKNYSRKGRGTTCLRNHLKSKHPVEFQTLSESDMKYMVKTEVSDSAPSRSHLQLQNADPLETNTNEFYDTHEKLALMIVQSDQSFDMIKGTGFINFIKVLQPRYKLNPISYYENMICQDIYQRMEAQLKQKLNMLETVSLSTSLWLDPSGQGLLSLYCHGIPSNFQATEFYLKCMVLYEGDLSDIACHVRNIISSASLELQLPKEKIHCIVRDEGTCGPGATMECSVHLLQLCVKYAIDANDHLQQVDSKCRQIVKHFQQSQTAYMHLKYIQEKRLNGEPFDPLMDAVDFNSSKWNSIFRLKANLLKLKDALSIYAEEYNMVKIYPDEWLDIDLCNRVIQPIEEIIGIWSTSTASSVIPLIAALRDSLRTDVHNFVSSVTTCSFARKLLEDLELRCSSLAKDIKYLVATYLDPRYKQAFFTQQQADLVTEEVLAQLSRVQSHHAWQPPAKISKTIIPNANVKLESKIDSFLDNMLTMSNSLEANSSLHFQTQMKNLLYLYNSEPRIERQSDPLAWWQSNPKYMSLFPVVKKFLSMPAASMSSERLYGQSTNLYGDLQSEIICPESSAKILFVKANFKLLEQA